MCVGRHLETHQIAMHYPLGGEELHALGDAVGPLEEEARVEAGGAEAAQVVLELAAVPDEKVLRNVFQHFQFFQRLQHFQFFQRFQPNNFN
jgi:hypothetical protein